VVARQSSKQLLLGKTYKNTYSDMFSICPTLGYIRRYIECRTVNFHLDLEVYSSRFLQYYNSSTVFKEFTIIIITLQSFKLKFVRVYCATVINIIEQFNKWMSLHIMTSHKSLCNIHADKKIVLALSYKFCLSEKVRIAFIG
jgi:hypothetical protein